MRGNIELIEYDPYNSAEYIEAAIHATERAAKLTDELLASGHKARFSPSREDVGKITTDVLARYNQIDGIEMNLKIAEGEQKLAPPPLIFPIVNAPYQILWLMP